MYFHDDESPLLNAPTPTTTAQPTPRAQWGFPPFLHLLQTNTTILRSSLLNARTSHGAELWLINPSKADREVHEVDLDEPTPYPPKPTYPANVFSTPTPKQSLLTSLSNFTNFSRKTAQQVLAHPLAQPVLPHLPPAVRSFVNVPGEWERPGRRPPRTGRGGEVENEFDSARLYLARWARVVAEEGERARRTERRAEIDPVDDDSSLGVFSLLTSPNSKRPVPHPTRDPQHPITNQNWESLSTKDEAFIRREIFRRGFSDSADQAQARREGWELLLGIVPWGETRKGELRLAKRQQYLKLKDAWRTQLNETQQEDWKEEWHRIDVGDTQRPG